MLRAIRIIIACCALLAACSHQAPQRPSQRKGEAPQADSAQLALLELNRQMALAADQQLAQLVQTQDATYALYENQVWMTVITRGDEDEPAPAEGEEWRIAMQVYDLKERLLMDAEGTYRIGKRELPQGVETNISELHRGGKARLLVPWYAAYGISGTEAIPPYENVIIDIELK